MRDDYFLELFFFFFYSWNTVFHTRTDTETKDFAFKISKTVFVSFLNQKRNAFLKAVSLLVLLLMQRKSRRGMKRALLLNMSSLQVISHCNGNNSVLITIRANHWSFQGENYPSVTCLSPGKAPKCPYYHQGHSMCQLYRVLCGCLCVCTCTRLTFLTSSCLCLSAS